MAEQPVNRARLANRARRSSHSRRVRLPDDRPNIRLA